MEEFHFIMGEGFLTNRMGHIDFMPTSRRQISLDIVSKEIQHIAIGI